MTPPTWRQALAAAAIVTALALIVITARGGDWGLIAVVVLGNLAWYGLVAVFRRVDPSKNPADYR